MAEFLDTQAISSKISMLIKESKDRLILISPYLQFSDKIKELLEDKNRLRTHVRIVYRENKLQPKEINWLKDLPSISTSFCKNLHAKCYLNEKECIITSMNLFRFSQENNDEMGILVLRKDDEKLYDDVYNEAQRLIRLSKETRVSVEIIEKKEISEESDKKPVAKIATSKLAAKLGIESGEMIKKLILEGYLELLGKDKILTKKGEAAGGEFHKGKVNYFSWFENFKP